MKLIGVHHINGRKYGRISSTAPSVFGHSGKGGGTAMLPNRAAVHELTGQNEVGSALGNYAKATPSGAGAIPFGTGVGKPPGIVGGES